jgi:hypothetical protein
VGDLYLTCVLLSSIVVSYYQTLIRRWGEGEMQG